ncbi:unnamed protein product [Lactuca saligna]|uniref:Uncharacterized protein n=1 Tax=Lactuca saligna TaxID=75948 RepID=A0AA35YV52_LACSI|nr:unnamed protein product [Lactuca saligna]
MILNEKYPQIERSSATLDMKALGPNTFGLMKQSRKASKVPYQGLKELVKFGKFAEVENTPAASSLTLRLSRNMWHLNQNFNLPLKRLKFLIMMNKKRIKKRNYQRMNMKILFSKYFIHRRGCYCHTSYCV